MPISYSQAALGATIEVPTLDGRENLAIPAGTQNGDVFTLKGAACPTPAATAAATCWCRPTSRCPALTPEHEALLRRLAEIENAQVSPTRKSFFEKLKELFSMESTDRSAKRDET